MQNVMATTNALHDAARKRYGKIYRPMLNIVSWQDATDLAVGSDEIADEIPF